MNILKKALHYACTRYGSFETKKKIWDQEFQSGRWRHLEDTRNDPVYAYIDKYANHGSILDLGCGSGATCLEIDEDVFSMYTGVDISQIAIDSANLKLKGTTKEDSAHFVLGDIESFKPDRKYDLLLFRESICYLPGRKILPTLEKYCKYVYKGGYIIIRLHDRNKYDYITKMIDKHYEVVDRYEPTESLTIIMVLSV
jgi:2-polyprenyl-6-hydroxyphenyl methylase/3-demethylubiquinone-9 3-methyltransferase